MYNLFENLLRHKIKYTLFNFVYKFVRTAGSCMGHLVLGNISFFYNRCLSVHHLDIFYCSPVPRA